MGRRRLRSRIGASDRPACHGERPTMQTLYRIRYSNGRKLLTTLAERAQAEHDSEGAKVYATTGDDL